MSKTSGASNVPTTNEPGTNEPGTNEPGTNEPGTSRLDEASRVRLIAKKHGLRPDGLAELISESRAQARRSRRRLSDVRLDDLVRGIGTSKGSPSSGSARKTQGSR